MIRGKHALMDGGRYICLPMFFLFRETTSKPEACFKPRNFLCQTQRFCHGVDANLQGHLQYLSDDPLVFFSWVIRTATFVWSKYINWTIFWTKIGYIAHTLPTNVTLSCSLNLIAGANHHSVVTPTGKVYVALYSGPFNGQMNSWTHTRTCLPRNSIVVLTGVGFNFPLILSSPRDRTIVNTATSIWPDSPTVENNNGEPIPITRWNSFRHKSRDPESPGERAAYTDPYALTKRTTTVFGYYSLWSLGHGVNCKIQES